jgi:hypothetical protein
VIGGQWLVTSAKILLFVLGLLSPLAFAQGSNLQLGDSYYNLRAENSKDNMANGKNVKEAIKYYGLALKNAAEKEAAAWKLLRAYYFLGCFATPDAKDRLNLFEKARKDGKSFLREFPKNTDIAYWYSVNLGLWASAVNPMVALNAGSVKESRDIAQMLIAAEKNGDSISAARGYQILGRAHQKIPRIIFVLNWVQKDSSEVYFKKSIRLNPKDLATHLFLAEYYKEAGRERETENILLPLLKMHPRRDEYLEDERNLIKMRKLLE